MLLALEWVCVYGWLLGGFLLFIYLALPAFDLGCRAPRSSILHPLVPCLPLLLSSTSASISKTSPFTSFLIDYLLLS